MSLAQDVSSPVSYHPDSGGISGVGQERTASVSYRIVLDSPLASEFDAEFFTPVFLGQSYNHHGRFVSYLRASGFSASREGTNSRVWRVDVEYSVTPPEKDLENPLNDPPDISGGSTTYEVAVTGAVSGDSWDVEEPLKTSAGQPVDPPPTKLQTGATLTISRNEPLSTDPRVLAARLTSTVNSTDWGGYGAGKVMLTGISYSKVWLYPEDGVPWAYWSMTYNFEVRPDGWQLEYPDIGDYYLDGSEKERDFKTDEGTPYAGFLDGDGGKSNSVVYIKKQIYAEVNFHVLNLPV